MNCFDKKKNLYGALEKVNAAKQQISESIAFADTLGISAENEEKCKFLLETLEKVQEEIRQIYLNEFPDELKK